LEKFTSLVEDIFEAEDSLPPDAEASDLNHEFFSSYSQDFSRPALSTAVIRKLTKYIGHVARPTKRLRQVSGGALGTPRGKGRMADVDTQVLSRLLKLLERSVKLGEDLDPLAHYTQSAPAPVSSTANASPKKSSTKKAAKPKKVERQSRSQTPKGGEDAVNGDVDSGDNVASEIDFEKLTIGLDTAHESILAADCCIALLASDRLTKQVCGGSLGELTTY
jgi:cohesin loading factor subunit SCC2